MTGSKIERLVKLIAKLPGLGPRSAQRIVVELLRQQETLLVPLIENLSEIEKLIVKCSLCANLDSQDPCSICQDPKRDRTTICVVENVDDLWAVERTRHYQGLYHVLGGTLSTLSNIRPEKLNLRHLVHRAQERDTSEIILALSVTVDGQTISYMIADQLSAVDVTLSRLSPGVPIGGELGHLDDETLTAAFKARGPM